MKLPEIPLHSFHPTVVHFPIALYLFGAFLDVVGARKDNQTMRSAAQMCFVGAAFSYLVVAPTGLAALLRNEMSFQWPPTTPPMIHFSLAVSSLACVVATAVWRRKGPKTGAGYWSLLVVTVGLVALAGHTGGNLVFP